MTYADLYPDDFQSWLDNCGMELDEKQIAQLRQTWKPDPSDYSEPIKPLGQAKMGKSKAASRWGQF